MAIIGISGKIGSGKDTVGKIIQGLIIGEDVFEGGVIGFLESYEDYETYPNKEWEIKKFATKLKQIVCLLTGCTMKQLEDQAFKNTYLPPEWDWYKTIGANSNGRPIYLRSPVTDVIRKEMGDRVYKTTYRELLQLLGTEALRNVIHENVYVNALFADYKPIGDYPIIEGDQYLRDEYVYPNWLITDTRFPNELKAIKDRQGITIRIERPFVKLGEKFKVDFCDDEYTCTGYGTYKNGGYTYFINNTNEWVAEHDILIEKSKHPSETSLDNAVFDHYIKNDRTIEELIEEVKQILIKEKII